MKKNKKKNINFVSNIQLIYIFSYKKEEKGFPACVKCGMRRTTYVLLNPHRFSS